LFERDPDGLESILLYLRRRFGLPIYITEHGSACDDESFRIADLRANLTAVHRALARGADVRGFFYWSLLDNFEWQFGHTKRFGLLSVDFDHEHLLRKGKPVAEVFRTACVQRLAKTAVKPARKPKRNGFRALISVSPRWVKPLLCPSRPTTYRMQKANP